MTLLNLAIVGIGWAGTRHTEAIRELNGDLAVTALVDNDVDHLRAKAAELSVPYTETALTAVLADPSIDAVSICTPMCCTAP